MEAVARYRDPVVNLNRGMRRLRATVPVEIRQTARYVVGLGGDVVDRVSGRANDNLPPRRHRYVGEGDFRAIGQEFLRHFVDVGGLKRDDDVLDVGCGIGRMAIPLTGYLAAGGSYRGFDIVPKGVRWCQKHITPRYPNFQFEAFDLRNTLYNRTATSDAANFRFPYRGASFDFVFATSVFTHLLPDAMRNYVGQIARVLRPGKTTLTTWLLLNPETRRGAAKNPGALTFKHDKGEYAVDDDRVPEAVTAYREEVAREVFAANDLDIQQIYFGSWSGRTESVSGQDIIVARRG
jgi:SAM-dependent methyltransferase